MLTIRRLGLVNLWSNAEKLEQRTINPLLNNSSGKQRESVSVQWVCFSWEDWLRIIMCNCVSHHQNRFSDSEVFFLDSEFPHFEKDFPRYQIIHSSSYLTLWNIQIETIMNLKSADWVQTFWHQLCIQLSEHSLMRITIPNCFLNACPCCAGKN